MGGKDEGILALAATRSGRVVVLTEEPSLPALRSPEAPKSRACCRLGCSEKQTESYQGGHENDCRGDGEYFMHRGDSRRQYTPKLTKSDPGATKLLGVQGHSLRDGFLIFPRRVGHPNPKRDSE